MSKHGYGRIPSKADGRNYGIDELTMLMRAGLTPVSYLDPVVLDQGDTPHCVGYGTAGFLATAEAKTPDDPGIKNSDGERIYYECKVVDGEPKAEDGSTVHSAAKVLLNVEKVIAAYGFLDFANAKKWIDSSGPVVIGIDWYDGMEDTDKNGIIHATGGIAGGHCILWTGTDMVINGVGYNRIRNSWGQSWGIGGDCFISDAELSPLIDGSDGEALACLKAAVVPVPVPTPVPGDATSEKLIKAGRANLAALAKHLGVE
jgi:Papain family cysteine protease